MSNMRSRYKVVIYDCDGVILDSIESNYVFYNRIMGYLGRPEIDRDNSDAKRVLHTYSFRDVMNYFFEGDQQQEEALSFAKTIRYRDRSRFSFRRSLQNYRTADRSE